MVFPIYLGIYYFSREAKDNLLPTLCSATTLPLPISLAQDNETTYQQAIPSSFITSTTMVADAVLIVASYHTTGWMYLHETYPGWIHDNILCVTAADEGDAKTCARLGCWARWSQFGATIRGGRATCCLAGPAEEGRVCGCVRGCRVEQNGGLQAPASCLAWHSECMGRCCAATITIT